MAGVAAGAQPHPQGVHETGDAPGRQAVQIRGVSRLQGGKIPKFFDWSVSESIHDHEHGFIHSYSRRNLRRSPRMNRWLTEKLSIFPWLEPYILKI